MPPFPQLYWTCFPSVGRELFLFCRGTSNRNDAAAACIESYGASPAIQDHTVLPATRHSWTHRALTPATQASTWFTYPGGMEGWVDLNKPVRNQETGRRTTSAVRKCPTPLVRLAADLSYKSCATWCKTWWLLHATCCGFVVDLRQVVQLVVRLLFVTTCCLLLFWTCRWLSICCGFVVQFVVTTSCTTDPQQVEVMESDISAAGVQPHSNHRCNKRFLRF